MPTWELHFPGTFAAGQPSDSRLGEGLFPHRPTPFHLLWKASWFYCACANVEPIVRKNELRGNCRRQKSVSSHASTPPFTFTRLNTNSVSSSTCFHGNPLVVSCRNGKPSRSSRKGRRRLIMLSFNRVKAGLQYPDATCCRFSFYSYFPACSGG